MEYIKRLLAGPARDRVQEKKEIVNKAKQVKHSAAESILLASSSKKSTGTAERWFDLQSDNIFAAEEPDYKHTELCELKRMEYSHDIYLYLRRIERLFSPREDFLRGKDDFRLGARYRFVEWLDRESSKIILGKRQGLKRETVHLAISLFDRYIELKTVAEPHSHLSQLGLVGLACLFIGCKHEEQSIPPQLILENSCFEGKFHEQDDIMNKEEEILSVLGWRLNHQGPIPFLEVIANDLIFSSQELTFIETLIHYNLLSGISTFYQSSMMAAMILRIIMIRRGQTEWSVNLLSKTMYTRCQLDQAIIKLQATIRVEKHQYDKLPMLRKLLFKVLDTVDTLRVPTAA